MPIALRLHIPGALVGVSRRGDGALRRTRSPYRHCAAHAAEHPLGGWSSPLITGKVAR